MHVNRHGFKLTHKWNCRAEERYWVQICHKATHLYPWAKVYRRDAHRSKSRKTSSSSIMPISICDDSEVFFFFLFSNENRRFSFAHDCHCSRGNSKTREESERTPRGCRVSSRLVYYWNQTSIVKNSYPAGARLSRRITTRRSSTSPSTLIREYVDLSREEKKKKKRNDCRHDFDVISTPRLWSKNVHAWWGGEDCWERRSR